MSLSFSNAHQQGSGTTEVVAVLIAITDNIARVLTVDKGKLLPNGPLMPLHRSLQAGVRQWVEAQTGQSLGYIEQLYTFVDTNRRNKEGHALVYVSYMGLVQESDIQAYNPNYPPDLKRETANQQTANQQTANQEKAEQERSKQETYKTDTTDSSSNSNSNTNNVNNANTNMAEWRDWYDYFPWENHLDNNVLVNIQPIVLQLLLWARAADSEEEQHKRLQRIGLCWGCEWQQDGLQADKTPVNGKQSGDLQDEPSPLDLCDCIETDVLQNKFSQWVAEHALLRYEMLYEAGLLPESPNYQPSHLPKNWQTLIGEPMYFDHRRVIATAISRLRAKIEYRPLIFGLMPAEFTLLQLQQSVEALSGVTLHKQNFRRLLESQNLLEPTGNSRQTGRGRPAKLFRFRFDIELQSLLMDSKLPKRNG